MKRNLMALLSLALAVMLAACANQPSALNEPEAAPQATAKTAETPNSTPEPTPEATPEPKTYVPMDIFSDEFNPFGTEVQGIFTVFEASFDKGSDMLEGKSVFVLSMTGSGNMFACVAYLADVAGLSEEEKNQHINAYLEGGFCEFAGKDGRIVTIRQARKDDDRYEYVKADGSHNQTGPGCVVDISCFIDEAGIEKYTKLVQDNYSALAMQPVCDYFDTSTDLSECGISVNVHKNEAHTYAVYYLPDADGVRKSIEANVDANWWEWSNHSYASFVHNDMECVLIFDSRAQAITVQQNTKKPDLPPAAEGSLTALGFGFDDAGTCGVFEQREPHYISVAIARQEWGAFNEDWNMEFMDTDVNGYILRITYQASDGGYEFSLNKDGMGCSFRRYPATGEMGWEHPDPETLHRMFNDAFGTEGKEMFFAPLDYFEQYIQEHFGMTFEALYALPKR